MLDENKNNPLETRNVGCVWEKQGKGGRIYYSGMAYGKNLIMLKNNSSSDKAPKFIFIRPEKEEK